MFQRMDAEVVKRCCQSVFLCGGVSKTKNFKFRLERELESLRPQGSVVKVYEAQDAVLDAYRGARLFATSDAFANSCVTKKDYEELGPEYLKEHACSNRYWPTTVQIPDELVEGEESQAEPVPEKRKRT